MDSENLKFRKIENEIASYLNVAENQMLFNNYFSQHIKDHPIERLCDSTNIKQTSFENLKIKTFCLFLYHSTEGTNMLNSIFKKYSGDDLDICTKILNVFTIVNKIKLSNMKLEELLEIKLNPDNIKLAIESFVNSHESADTCYNYHEAARIFEKSFLDLFDKIPNDEQCKVDSIIINRCIRKFDGAAESPRLTNEFILKIMKYTDCKKKIPSKNKRVTAIIDNFKLLACKFDVPDLFVKFTFKFMDFEKLKRPQQESIDEKNARYNLIYDTIYFLVDSIAIADLETWFDAFKHLLQDDIYSEFVSVLNGIEDIYDILSFETMNKFNSGYVRKLKKLLQEEHLKFVVKKSENGNKKINVVVEKNYVCQKQKLKSVNKIKIPNTAEIKSINDENRGTNKLVLKIFFIPKKNKNKWVAFYVDVVLFLIILSAFVMPCFIAAPALLYSVFVLTLEIICGLLSLVYGIILLENIYFQNESNGKINIKSNKGTLDLQSKIKNNQDISLRNNEKNLFK